MLRSSANRFAVTGVSIVLTMSFIDRRKIVTASDDPWGIPFSWVKMFERQFETLTRNFLSERMFFI